MASSNKEVQDGIKEIKSYLSTHLKSHETTLPPVSVVDDDLLGASLTSAFMKNAEIFQHWNTIGIYQWIEAGRWWLVRVSLGALISWNSSFPLLELIL